MASLDEQIAEVVARVADAPGLDTLLFCGSGVRGELQPHSDLDFIAVIRDDVPWPQPFRDGGRDVIINSSGRQVEVAYATAGYLRRRMAETAAAGEPFRAEALVEGHRLLAQGPPRLADKDLRWECYRLWNLHKDVQDSLDDPPTARYLMPALFDGLVRLFFRLERRWLPRPRRVLTAIDAVDAEVAALSYRYVEGCAAEAQHAALVAIMVHLARRFSLTFDGPYRTGANQPNSSTQ